MVTLKGDLAPSGEATLNPLALTNHAPMESPEVQVPVAGKTQVVAQMKLTAQTVRTAAVVLTATRASPKP
jgi:hypothetical protein